LFLDLLDRVGQGRGRGQAHREQAGEPAQGAGQVDVVEQVFTAVAFKLDQAGGMPGPAANDACQGGEQQVIDLRTVGGGCLLQKLARAFCIQLADHGPGHAARTRTLWITARKLGGHALQLLQPEGFRR